MTKDEIVGWHHQLNEHEFEQAPEVGDGQGSLACCSSWGHKELDTTEWLNGNSFIMQIHNTEGQREAKEQKRNFMFQVFLPYDMNFISQDESASKLIQVVGSTQFLAVVGLRCPFPAGSLTLLPEPAHFPFQDFLVVPCVLRVFPSITSFYLRPEKVICSCDRLGVFVSYGCYDNKLPETVTYDHGHLFLLLFRRSDV